MKTSAIVCAVLAGSFGFTSVASARDWRGDDRGHDRQHRVEQRHDRPQRAEQRHERRAERDGRHAQRQQFRAHVQPQRPVYRAPAYTYNHPTYRAPAHRFYRGGYLPAPYRTHTYYVNDWHAYPGLYAPPYGQQWVNIDGEFLLVALATGLIVNALIQ
ncbi:MAG TPA: RcnB family protein [Ramlibacter sp.]|uniref:RcnB family protein n=1 Tax=Ramlibacter sp. TaxID=1917967 RepID=UPI002D7F0E37|nr:RcnB family protein [Ramlibacter sp.]HET8745572.1 RcnB family protein [Ramlibacter sp.]